MNKELTPEELSEYAWQALMKYLLGDVWDKYEENDKRKKSNKELQEDDETT